MLSVSQKLMEHVAAQRLYECGVTVLAQRLLQKAYAPEHPNLPDARTPPTERGRLVTRVGSFRILKAGSARVAFMQSYGHSSGRSIPTHSQQPGC